MDDIEGLTPHASRVNGTVPEATISWRFTYLCWNIPHIENPQPLVEPSEHGGSEQRLPKQAEIQPPSSTEESMAEKMLKLKRVADATKNNVRVTEQVFSCVTDYAIIRGATRSTS